MSTRLDQHGELQGHRRQAAGLHLRGVLDQVARPEASVQARFKGSRVQRHIHLKDGAR